jgi:hypothetical protein
MPHVALVAPLFLENTNRYVRAFAGLPGLTLSVISQDPERSLPPDLKSQCWAAAQGATADPQWCDPFSMASEGKVSSIGFPVRNFNDEVMKWVNRIADAINSGV